MLDTFSVFNILQRTPREWAVSNISQFGISCFILFYNFRSSFLEASFLL